LYATRNFYLKYSDGDENKVSIAVWHVVPNHIVRQFHRELRIRPGVLRNLTVNEEQLRGQTVEGLVVDDKFDINDHRQKEALFEELVRKSNAPVVLYFHGNTGSRANGHRIELYGTLRRLGYHIFAIDYRGFADSSEHSPTERGCVSDALAIYKYIKNLTRNPIYIYGHSLGETRFL
jgi:abhydrolase domain-containing protein 12